jgi:type II secretory pathway pseudopilin PulG
MKPSYTFSRLRAFTLTELLISVGITSLIVVMLGQMFSSATALWRTSGQRIDSFRDGRAALQLMAADLSRANIRGDVNMLTLKPPGGDYATEADAVSPIKNTGKSDLCVVEYYLSWSDATKTYSLMRRFKNSDTTIDYLKTSPLDFDAIYRRDSGTEEVIATPVWALEIRPGETDNVITPVTGSGAQWRWIEIRFKTMSVNAARKLSTIPSITQAIWDDPGSTTYRRLILPDEQQFVIRVSLEQNR